MSTINKSSISIVSEVSDSDSAKPIKKDNMLDATEGILINGKKMEKIVDVKQPGKIYFGKSHIMANDILEFLILKTRLELSNAEKKKMFKIRDDFMTDCHSNITTFQVRLITDFFSRDEAKLVSDLNYFDRIFRLKRLEYLIKSPVRGQIKNARTCYP